MQNSFVLTDRSKQQLLAGVRALAGRERGITAQLIAHLAEIDARRLYLEEGFSSLFKYCIEALGFSEDAAYRRIDAARVARRYPIVFEMLAQGAIHLTTIRILGPCLTEENHERALNAARHQSKEALERLAAALRPLPDVPALVRKLPDASPQSVLPEGPALFAGNGSAVRSVQEDVSTAAPVCPGHAQRPLVSPVSPARYKLQLTLDAETYQALRQLQELLRHQIPNGDLVTIVKDALLLCLAQVKRDKLAQVNRPRRKHGQTSWVPSEGRQDRGNSRHIPADVKRSVWERDQGRCAFVSKNGRRCSERGRIEFHHVEPFAWGGQATVRNIALRCRAHNAYEGSLVFGLNGKNLTGPGASSMA